MSSKSIHWSINTASMGRSLRGLWALATLGFLGIIHHLIIANIRPEIVFLTSLLAAAFFFITLKAYRSNITQKISLHADNLEVPRLLLKPRRIQICNIISIKIYKNHDLNQTILLNLNSGRPFLIDKSLFSSAAYFDIFVEQIQIAMKTSRQVQETTFVSCAAANVLSTHILDFVVSTFICIAFLIFSKNFSEIDPLAVQIGAVTKDSFASKEWYRLFSSFFLHDNFVHLSLNIIALGIFLPPVEIMVGKVRAVNILLLSSFTSAIFSVLLSPYQYVIGASGGILGLMGACSAFYFRHKKEFTSQTIISGTALLLAAGSQAIGDFLIPSVDITSHVAGFIFGVICGYLVPSVYNMKTNTGRLYGPRATAACLTSAFFLSLFYLVWQFMSG